MLYFFIVGVWDVVCIAGIVAHFSGVTTTSFIMPPFWASNGETRDLFAENNAFFTFDLVVTCLDLMIIIVSALSVGVRNRDSLRFCLCASSTNWLFEVAFFIWLVIAFFISELKHRLTSTGLVNAICLALVPYAVAVILRGYGLHILLRYQRELLVGERQTLINP